MGCGGSKLDSDEATLAGVRPIRARIVEIGTRGLDRGRARKDSIVSTTGLLQSEEEDEAAVDEAPGASPGAEARKAPDSLPAPMVSPLLVVVESARQPREARAAPAVMEPAAAGFEERAEVGEEGSGPGEDEQAGGEKRALRGPALLCGGGRRLGHDDEGLPGSPSFRIFFADSIPGSSDDDSSNAFPINHAGKMKEGKECSPGWKDSLDSNSEESEGKSSRRHRAKRFKGLAKGPSAMYGFLNVRSCYSVHNNSPCHSSTPNENPSLQPEKVA